MELQEKQEHKDEKHIVGRSIMTSSKRGGGGNEILQMVGNDFGLFVLFFEGEWGYDEVGVFF